MTKKFLVVMLSAVLAIGLFSCNMFNNDDDDDESANSTAVYTMENLYGNTYAGTLSGIIFTLNVTNASYLTFSGVMGSNTMFNVDNEPYTAELTSTNNYSVTTTNTNSGNSLTFSIAITSESEVTVVYSSSMNVVLTKSN